MLNFDPNEQSLNNKPRLAVIRLWFTSNYSFSCLFAHNIIMVNKTIMVAKRNIYCYPIILFYNYGRNSDECRCLLLCLVPIQTKRRLIIKFSGVLFIQACRHGVPEQTSSQADKSSKRRKIYVENKYLFINILWFSY